MNWLRLLLVLGLVALPARAGEAQRLRSYIDGLISEYTSLGKKPYETRWPSGQIREKYEVETDGTLSYTRLFQGGGYAVRFQRKASKAISYEAWYGNGKTKEILTYDDRTIAYTSYWENGQKRERLMVNRLLKSTSYQAYDKSGKERH